MFVHKDLATDDQNKLNTHHVVFNNIKKKMKLLVFIVILSLDLFYGAVVQYIVLFYKFLTWSPSKRPMFQALLRQILKSITLSM